MTVLLLAAPGDFSREKWEEALRRYTTATAQGDDATKRGALSELERLYAAGEHSEGSDERWRIISALKTSPK